MHAALEPTHSCIVTVSLRAIVGQKQHNGVVGDFQGVQPTHQTANIVINIGAHSVDGRQRVIEPFSFIRVKYLSGT